MKIDLHTHTRKAKKGDAKTREVSPDVLCGIVTSTDVKILAITNHNMFDREQYDEICDKLNGEVQVWPGVELDIVERGKRGHMLLIVSPQKVTDFSSALDTLTKGCTPDSFTTDIEGVVGNFDFLGPLYIGHYKKKPDLSEEDLERLVGLTKNKSRVIKEVTNSISAGIFVSHGHPSIYGSDIQDWEKYEDVAKGLPELRFPVESFEHFCLLLEKDQLTINTILDKKKAEILELQPFDDDTKIKLKVYNDINIFFGSKGTGKSCLLSSIARHYSDSGVDARVFQSGSTQLAEQYDLKGKTFSINLETHGVNYCTDEIGALKKAREVDVTSLNNYISYFSAENRSKSANKIFLKDMERVEEEAAKRKFKEYDESTKTLQNFYDFMSKDDVIREVFKQGDLDDMMNKVQSLLQTLGEERWKRFVEWKEGHLLNGAIEKIKLEVSRKTGLPGKPSGTGFREYALNRIKIDAMAGKVLENLANPIPYGIEDIGNLGGEKGILSCKTRVCFQKGDITDSTLSAVAKVKKETQKKFAKAVLKVRDSAYGKDLFEVIADMNEIDGSEDIQSIYELLLFGRTFVAGGREYFPSSGESSMLLLHKELDAEKDVYILDEPEKSLGNDYINDVIVPMINSKAKLGKKVFIATHDANIAVRTLPYNSIYRTHGSEGYSTYVGNPFSDHLVNIGDEADRLDWKKISMKTLEGGESAFGERGKIYGET